MAQKLRILILEDTQAEAELMERYLARKGFDFTAVRVETRAAYTRELDSGADLILAELSLPSLDGIEALRLRQEHAPFVPFIFVSGRIGEDIAVELIKQGATDYVLKQNMQRLAASARRALREAEEIRERAQTRAALAESVHTCKALIDAPTYSAIIVTPQGRIVDTNEVGASQLGLSREQLLGKDVFPYLAEGMPQLAAGRLEQAIRVRAPVRFEHSLGSSASDNTIYPVVNAQGEVIRLVLLVQDITERVQAHRGLQQAEARYRNLVEQTPAIVFLVDIKDRRFRYVSPQIREYRISPEEFINRTERFYRFIHPDDRRRVIAEMRRSNKSGQPFSSEFRVLLADGRQVWFHSQAREVDDGTGRQLYQGVLVDITARKRTEAALREAEERYRGLFENSLEGIFKTTTDGEIITANPALASILGYSSPEEFMRAESNLGAIFADRLQWQEIVGRVRNGETVSHFEARARQRGGTLIWVSLNARGIYGFRDELLTLEGWLADISDRKQMEEALRSMSLVDDLTGLYNRRGLMTVMERDLKRAQRQGWEAMLLFADLDSMKWINDNLGHIAGDEALRGVARVLRQTFRESDVLARIGGDEFVVFGLEADKADEQRLLNRLRANLDSDSARSGHAAGLSLSVGIAYYDPGKPDTMEELIDRADRLMYEDKKKKKLDVGKS